MLNIPTSVPRVLHLHTCRERDTGRNIIVHGRGEKSATAMGASYSFHGGAVTPSNPQSPQTLGPKTS